jgi:hypothetical protein
VQIKRCGTGRFPCRFDILLEKEENGDVFGGGREE